MKFYYILFILFISCSSSPQKSHTTAEKQGAEAVTLLTYGGQMGYFQSLKVTDDSLFFTLTVGTDSTKNRRQIIRNDSYKINDIITSSDVEKFSRLRSGKSYLPVDGTDTDIIIEKKQQKFKVTNGTDSIWYKAQEKLEKIIDDKFGEL